MIHGVSMTNNRIPFSQDNKQKLSNTSAFNKVTPFVDSFVKNSIDSTPMLLAITGGWTAYDVISKKSTLPKALTNNFLGFFAPVMLISSTILSVVENKKTSKSSN